MAGKGARVFLVAVVVCLLSAPHVAAITCPAVVKTIAPCLSYATGKAPSPTAACCNGVKTLKSLAKTKADRQAGCNCLKSYAPKIKGLIPARITGLPKTCKVAVPFPISTTIDCSRIP